MDKKKEIINILKNTYCRLSNSKIEGVGVFAIKDIPKGICPFPVMNNCEWYGFNLTELKDLNQETMKMIDDYFVIEKNGTVRIPESVFNMDFSFFVNHSKNANLETIDNGFTFVAKRDIKKGEELLVDYGEYDEKWINI